MSTGGPAFPGPYVNEKGGLEAVWKQGGMTLRDYFAAKAMQGMCANPEANPSTGPDVWAAAAYEVADAMLLARGIK